jgi:hypothetical protein
MFDPVGSKAHTAGVTKTPSASCCSADSFLCGEGRRPLAAACPPAGAPAPAAPEADEQIQIVQQGTTATEGVSSADLCPLCGLICVVLSCYPKFPECIGCSTKGEFLCCQLEGVLCKTGRTEGSICMCMKQEVEIIQPTVCVKLTEQCFCLDLRCSLPHDEDVPCICAVAGIKCMRNYKCECEVGGSLGDKKEGDDEAAGAPPMPDFPEEAAVGSETMDRCV